MSESDEENNDPNYDSQDHFSVEDLISVLDETRSTTGVTPRVYLVPNKRANVNPGHLQEAHFPGPSTASAPRTDNAPSSSSKQLLLTPSEKVTVLPEPTTDIVNQPDGSLTGTSSSQHSSAEYPGDMKAGRKRKRKSDESSWFLTVNRKRRMQGKSYVVYQSNSSGKRTKIERKERTMGPKCSSAVCKKIKARCCDQFTDDDRLAIYNEFWNSMDWNHKRACVINLVDKHKTIRKTTEGPSRRKDSFVFYLKLNGEKRQVCRKMFLSTLGIGDYQMRDWVNNKKFVRKPREMNDVSVDQKLQIANQFLNELPKMPSHYCRKESSKLYLEPVFSSKSEIFREYQNYCVTKNALSLSRKSFLQLIDKNNISIFQPRKDMCDLCCGHEAGNVQDEDYASHIRKKDEAQREKEKDKESAILGNCHTVTMDLQAVKLSPMLNASSLYYKTKLIVHNFTVYDLASSDVTCFIWDESEGGLVASVFATCLLQFLTKHDDGKPIIIFSDGCVHQNRNAMLSAALLELAVSKKKTIIQKFLEKGHTMMEVDSVHSAIERKLKHRTINLPTDYLKFCKEARIHPKPYEVKYMCHSDFLNYSGKAVQRYTSIKPSNCTGGACVTDIRQIRYEPSRTIEFKLNHSDKDWNPLPRNPKTPSETPQRLYASKLPITKRKYQDLQDLLPVLPSSCHEYYRSLSFK